MRCSVSSTKSQGLGPVEFPSCLPLIFFKKPFISTIRHFRAGCTVSSAFQTGVAGEIVSFLFSVSSSSPRRVICSRFYLFSSRSSIILSHIVPRRSPDMAASPQPPPLPGPTQRPLCSSLGTQTPDFSGSPHPVSFPPKTVGTRLFLWGGGHAWSRAGVGTWLDESAGGAGLARVQLPPAPHGPPAASPLCLPSLPSASASLSASEPGLPQGAGGSVKSPRAHTASGLHLLALTSASVPPAGALLSAFWIQSGL